MSDEEVDELLKAVDTTSGEINYTGKPSSPPHSPLVFALLKSFLIDRSPPKQNSSAQSSPIKTLFPAFTIQSISFHASSEYDFPWRFWVPGVLL